MYKFLSKADNYPKSLVYLMHSVIHSDGVVHDKEMDLIDNIYNHESVPDDVNSSFLSDMKRLNADEMYKKGLEALKSCLREEQCRTLAWIHTVIEVDDKVDVKEARFLLYAMNSTDIKLEEIIEIAKDLPKLSE